jgi:hypothetical protein
MDRAVSAALVCDATDAGVRAIGVEPDPDRPKLMTTPANSDSGASAA